MNHWELSQKIALRWHLTPLRASKFLPSSSPPCRRGCGDTGHLMHMFWICKNLTCFWRNVFSFLSDITGILTPPEPSLGIPNLGIDRFPPSCLSIVMHILLAARLLIARGWKSNKVPNLSEVVEIVRLHYKYEAMLATKQGTRKSFASIWQLWTDRFTILHTPPAAIIFLDAGFSAS